MIFVFMHPYNVFIYIWRTSNIISLCWMAMTTWACVPSSSPLCHRIFNWLWRCQATGEEAVCNTQMTIWQICTETAFTIMEKYANAPQWGVLCPSAFVWNFVVCMSVHSSKIYTVIRIVLYWFSLFIFFITYIHSCICYFQFLHKHLVWAHARIYGPAHWGLIGMFLFFSSDTNYS